MAALYIHIPFCHSRCVYCDFCSSTLDSKVQHLYTDALIHEMTARRNYLDGAEIATVYFGGGTPSILTENDLARILATIRSTFNIKVSAEITLEANPDDISAERVDRWMDLGINRLSIGVQSFDDDLLGLLHRRHTAKQAIDAVNTAYHAGLKNISIDLMYGLPTLQTQTWEHTLQEAFSLPITHLSAYCLSVEGGTPLAAKLDKGELCLPDDEACEAQYRLLISEATKAGFEHYEISNFSRPDMYSRHNSSYWGGIPYLGLGAGAHSFNGTSRRANTTDVLLYIKRNGNAPFETETLTTTDHINETIFLSLRTRNGLNTILFKEQYGEKTIKTVLHAAAPHIAAGRISHIAGHLRLTEEGVFVSNDIISDLLFVD